jgi:glutamine amidotransferase
MIAVIDSGGANISSVLFALERLGARGELTGDKEAIARASHVILPGVGAAGDAMARLRAHGLVEVIRGLRQPVLGICLGMQLLFSHSEEGDTKMLDIIKAPVRRFEGGPGLTVPHMGWNDARLSGGHPLTGGLEEKSHFYFVHSYRAPAGRYTIGSCDYGGAFSAIVAQDNFMGCQFHPERSGRAGSRLLKNFLEM